MKCTYRANTPCRFADNPYRASQNKQCQLCLIGQLCDETSLNTRAFMDASIDKTEDGMSEQEWMDSERSKEATK